MWVAQHPNLTVSVWVCAWAVAHIAALAHMGYWVADVNWLASLSSLNHHMQWLSELLACIEAAILRMLCQHDKHHQHDNHTCDAGSLPTCLLVAMVQALANQVCEKVESKQRTTYNEVADELVSEFGNVEGTGQDCSHLHACLCGCTAAPVLTRIAPPALNQHCRLPEKSQYLTST